MNKTVNNRAWFLVLPVVLSVAFSAIIPLMTVVNYSIQDVLGPNQRVFVGGEWFQEVLRDPEIHSAFFRQLFYSLIVLLRHADDPQPVIADAVSVPLRLTVTLLKALPPVTICPRKAAV